MNVITEVTVGKEKIFYTIQAFMPDANKWVSLKDVDSEWEAIEKCNEWNEMLPDMHRAIETACCVSVVHSDYPDFP